MKRLRLLRPEEVIDRWDELSERLRAAVALGRGEVEVSDIKAMVLAGRMFIMATDVFAITCEFVVYPRKTVMIAGFGSGEVDDYDDVLSALKEFANKGGASSIQTYCRKPSMVRYYAKYFEDVAPVYTVLETKL